MKVRYNKEVDTLTLRFSDRAIVESDEINPGMIFDYDENGDVVGIEILDASKRIINPTTVELSVTGP